MTTSGVEDGHTRLAGFVASGFVLIGVVLSLFLPDMPQPGRDVVAVDPASEPRTDAGGDEDGEPDDAGAAA